MQCLSRKNSISGLFPYIGTVALFCMHTSFSSIISNNPVLSVLLFFQEGIDQLVDIGVMTVNRQLKCICHPSTDLLIMVDCLVLEILESMVSSLAINIVVLPVIKKIGYKAFNIWPSII